MSATSAIAALTVAYLDPEQRTEHIVAAGAALAVLPWTALTMAGVNNRLMELGSSATMAEKAGGEVLGLLKQWTWMNFVRTGMALVAGSVVLSAVMRKDGTVERLAGSNRSL